MIAVRKRISDTKLINKRAVDSSAFEIFERMHRFGRFQKSLVKIARGKIEKIEKFVFLACNPRILPLEFHACTLRKQPKCFGKIKPLNFHDKRKNISAVIAPETMPNLFWDTHHE